MRTPAETAKLIKEYYRTHNWVQGNYITADGACLDGACHTINPHDITSRVAFRMEAKRILGIERTEELWQWNDRPTTRYSHVQYLLDQIAKEGANGQAQA